MLENHLFSYIFKSRQHPIKIFTYTTSGFWLLLIPLARKLYRLSFDVAEWFRGDWLDIIIISIIFGFAFLRWFFITFSIDDDCIRTGTGYFGLLKSKFNYNTICSVTCSQGPFYRFFGCYKVCIDTNADFMRGHDVTLTLKKSDFKHLTNILKEKNIGKVKYSYTPKRVHLIIFSFLFSSTLSGVILLSTLLIQASRIIGRQLEQKYLTIVNDRIQNFLTINLPPIAVAAASIIVVGWLYSLAVNLLRHWNFTTVRQGDSIIIKSGFITNRESVIMRDKIYSVDIRQNFFMRMFHICSVNIDCAGYGKGRRQIAVLLPVTTNREINNSLKILLPDRINPHNKLKSRFRDFIGFTTPPFLLGISIPVLAYIMWRIFPEWLVIIRFVAFIAEIPVFWLFVVKFASIFTTGVGFEDGYAVLNYCKLYQFHKVTIPASQITRIDYYQTIIQKWSKNCSLRIYTYSENVKCHKVKNFPLKQAKKLLENQGYYMEVN